MQNGVLLALNTHSGTCLAGFLLPWWWKPTFSCMSCSQQLFQKCKLYILLAFILLKSGVLGLSSTSCFHSCFFQRTQHLHVKSSEAWRMHQSSVTFCPNLLHIWMHLSFKPLTLQLYWLFLLPQPSLLLPEDETWPGSRWSEILFPCNCVTLNSGLIQPSLFSVSSRQAVLNIPDRQTFWTFRWREY